MAAERGEEKSSKLVSITHLVSLVPFFDDQNVHQISLPSDEKPWVSMLVKGFYNEPKVDIDNEPQFFTPKVKRR